MGFMHSKLCAYVPNSIVCYASTRHNYYATSGVPYVALQLGKVLCNERPGWPAMGKNAAHALLGKPVDSP